MPECSKLKVPAIAQQKPLLWCSRQGWAAVNTSFNKGADSTQVLPLLSTRFRISGAESSAVTGGPLERRGGISCWGTPTRKYPSTSEHFRGQEISRRRGEAAAERDEARRKEDTEVEKEAEREENGAAEGDRERTVN
ncbi:hypothetical protein NDU88_002395 [Pleurodeles waltl]|uniref:Uncharacterized protein n=1 Tax=Pleurodeles waltl TaxID=8319 RepID=A0AAV7KSK2_PLEWA|nr:hypothetical protein NDU88_002395 [Pleurodeles waltl]